RERHRAVATSSGSGESHGARRDHGRCGRFVRRYRADSSTCAETPQRHSRRGRVVHVNYQPSRLREPGFFGTMRDRHRKSETPAPRGRRLIDVMVVSGTDFGTQTSSFCSVKTFQELYLPYCRKVGRWIHENTEWKTFAHSCGSVERFIPSFIEAGIDI